MNILVVPTTDWINNPNPHRLNFIFDNLVERGHNVYVLHFRLRQYDGKNCKKTKCTLIPVGGVSVKDQSLYYVLNAVKIFLVMRNIVKDKKIDVILSSNIIPAFLSNFMGVPVVHDYLDHWEESASVCYKYGSLKQKIVRFFVRFITLYNLRHATRIITVTKELKDVIEAQIQTKDKKITPHQIDVIPNGVDTSLLTPINKDIARKNKLNGFNGRVIGYVGTLEDWIDFEPIFKNLKSLDSKLLIVGSSLYTSYEEHLKERIRFYNIEDYVIFAGHIPYESINEYISAMDIGLNPLKIMTKNVYSAGGKVFNYLSCGVPVLSSHIISLEKMFEDFPGAITFYNDSNFWIIANVLLDSTGKNNAEYLRDISKKYDWRNISLEYEKSLEMTIKQ